MTDRNGSPDTGSFSAIRCLLISGSERVPALPPGWQARLRPSTVAARKVPTVRSADNEAWHTGGTHEWHDSKRGRRFSAGGAIVRQRPADTMTISQRGPALALNPDLIQPQAVVRLNIKRSLTQRMRGAIM